MSCTITIDQKGLTFEAVRKRRKAVREPAAFRDADTLMKQIFEAEQIRESGFFAGGDEAGEPNDDGLAIEVVESGGDLLAMGAPAGTQVDIFQRLVEVAILAGFGLIAVIYFFH